MATDKPSSYLATVKEELRQAVTEITESQEPMDNDQITNRIWRLFEIKLKESFLNGKKASSNGSLKAKAEAERPRNAWRR